MMKQNISRLALSAIALLAVSCNDSFMDRQPQTEIGVSSYFNTEEDLKMYCYNLYAVSYTHLTLPTNREV